MNFKYDCLHCHINQGLKVASHLKLNDKETEALLKEILSFLSDADFNTQNPEIMAKTWERITAITNNKDPYETFKNHYNDMLLEITPKLNTIIDQHPEPFIHYLYAAILGNIIDLGPSHAFESDNWIKTFTDELDHIELALNDSDALFNELSKANTLLYLGDNCGEIVLDKMFITYLKSTFPDLDITFSVRGEPVLNDATMKDAEQIGLTRLVKTISNGENTPGLIYNKTSEEFKELFDSSDIIIAKGQGNFEGLSGMNDPRIFHLFMVKCDLIARETGVANLSKVCYRQH